MKITKFVHSCLLVEDNSKTILIDPGMYTYEEKALDIAKLNSLDYIVITHEHFDHLYIPFIKELLQNFPNVTIISNEAVVALLAKENIQASTSTSDIITLQQAPHEKVFGVVTMPQNSIVTIANKLTHPGDSLSFEITAEILALPVQAPWGSLTQAVEHALKLQPKYIVPIHDWHWNEKAREAFYQRLKPFFAENNIDFKTPKTGEEINF